MNSSLGDNETVDEIPLEDGSADGASDSASSARAPLRSVGSTLEEALRRAEARRVGAEKPIPLPWPDMAAQFGGGLWPGCHVLVGGTGAGKTAWALQVALHAAKSGYPTGYVGLELEDMQIALRLLGEESRPHVPWSDLYLGKVTADQMADAREQTSALAALPFYLEMGRPGGWPVTELGAFIEQLRAKHPEENGAGSLPMLVVVDFLQIVGDEVGAGGRMLGLDLRERIGKASYFARDAARRHNVAVLLISSAARDKYGVLSGAIEDAGLTLEEAHDTFGKPTLGADGKPVPPKRSLLRPDSLIGLGKESGEIEYSADSVTAAIRWPEKAIDGASPVIFATAKGRATGAAWSELRFNGFRFAEAPENGRHIRNRLEDAEARKKKTPRSGSSATTPPTDPESDDNRGQRSGYEF